MNINSISSVPAKSKVWTMQAPLSEGRKLILNHTAKDAEIFIVNKNNRILDGAGVHKPNGDILGEVFNWLRKFQNDTIGEMDLLNEFVNGTKLK